MAGPRGHGFTDDASVPPPCVRLRGGRTPARVRRPPGKVVVTFGVLMMLIGLGVGINGFVGSVANLPYRAGWAGTPGTASLITCVHVPAGRSTEVDCVGLFRAADGTVTTPFADIEGHTSLDGRDRPARLHSDGTTMSIVSAATVLFALAGAFGWLVMVLLFGGLTMFAALAAVQRWRGRPARPSKWRDRGVLIAIGGSALTAIVLLIVGSAIGV